MIKLRFYELDDKKYDYCAFAGGDELKLSPPIPSYVKVHRIGDYANFTLNDGFLLSFVVEMAKDAFARFGEICSLLENETDGFRFAALSELISAVRDFNGEDCFKENSIERQKLAAFAKKERELCLHIISTKQIKDGEYVFPFDRAPRALNRILSDMHNVIRDAEEKNALPEIIILAVLGAVCCEYEQKEL